MQLSVRAHFKGPLVSDLLHSVLVDSMLHQCRYKMMPVIPTGGLRRDAAVVQCLLAFSCRCSWTADIMRARDPVLVTVLVPGAIRKLRRHERQLHNRPPGAPTTHPISRLVSQMVHSREAICSLLTLLRHG
eukprot:COSAG06_NODE_2189_length_7384_cov_1.396980_2_plen_131_part_00